MGDVIIQIDRSRRPTYPRCVRQPLHEDLEYAGPDQYGLRQVQCWYHHAQGKEEILYHEIYACLKYFDLLGRCLSLWDGEAIKKSVTPVLFEQFFPNQSPVLWRSVAVGLNGKLIVPSLLLAGGEVYTNWLSLKSISNSTKPALHH